jgi:hypothetical protein
MRNTKLLIVIAMIVLVLFQAHAASACQEEALVYRVVLQNYGAAALIYLSLVSQIGQPADLYVRTTNAAIIALALASVHSYLWAYFETDLGFCPASGFGGDVTIAGAYNASYQW